MRDPREAPTTTRTTWRQNLAGCAALGCLVAGGLLAIVAIMVLLVGFDIGVERLRPLASDLITQPPIEGLIGFAFIGFAVWGGYRMATGHSAPGMSTRDIRSAAAIIVGIAFLGLLLLLQATGRRLG